MADRRPNILMMVADTQRAQNLHCYGYEKETSPTWDAIAAEGVVCEQNISPGIWSLPGYASMFTGVHVATHRGDADHEYVARGLPTLSEVLGTAGYQTCGLMPNTWGAGAVGLDRGFEVYVDWGASRNDPPVRGWEMPKDETGGDPGRIETLGRWLDDRDTSRPFFLFTVFGDPHATYHPPEHHMREFLPDDVTDEELQVVLDEQDVIAMHAEDVVFDERQWEILFALNDACVRNCDEKFRVCIEHLKQRGLFDDTVIILTSDHGDVMGDRPPWWGHLGEICDSLIHVPLVMRYPEAIEPGTRISGITQTHDVFATCCEIAGAEVPSPAREQSRSIISAAQGEGIREFALAEAYKPVQIMERVLRRYPDFDIRRFNYSMKAWRSTTEKYVWRSDGRDEYYRVDEDPWNRNNLIGENQRRANELQQMMLDYLLSIDRNEFGDLQSIWPGKAAKPEIAAKLQALGLYRKVLDWPDWAPR